MYKFSTIILIILFSSVSQIEAQEVKSTHSDDTTRTSKVIHTLIQKTNILRHEDYGLWPFPAINKIDGFQLGLIFTNKISNEKKWNYFIAPSYGFKTKSILGTAKLSYTKQTENKFYKSISYGIDYRSYHFQKNNQSGLFKSNDLRYQRIRPYIQVNLKKGDTKHIQHSFTISSIQLFKDQVFYTITNPIIKNIYSRYDRIRHDYKNTASFYPIDLVTTLEYHSYKPFDTRESYLKISTIFNTEENYNDDKKVYLRFFAGGYLFNTNRKSSSYNNIITEGSLSLFSEGYQDYTFENQRYDRINQDSKVSFIKRNQSGGFGVGLGSQYNRIGQSNNFVIALNMKVDLPFPRNLNILKLYADVGIVSQLESYQTGKMKNVFLYTSGIEIDLNKGMFEILIPIFSSEDIQNVLKERGGILNRISVSVNINKHKKRSKNN